MDFERSISHQDGTTLSSTVGNAHYTTTIQYNNWIADIPSTLEDKQEVLLLAVKISGRLTGF